MTALSHVARAACRLSSEELSFEHRLGSSGLHDPLLAQWQLALALHASSRSRHRFACQMILPLFHGDEVRADADTDDARSRRRRIGFRPLSDELVYHEGSAKPAGVAGRGVPDDGGEDGRKWSDANGYFWPRPLEPQRTAFSEAVM
jgi:hypothetical protein